MSKQLPRLPRNEQPHFMSNLDRDRKHVMLESAGVPATYPFMKPSGLPHLARIRREQSPFILVSKSLQVPLMNPQHQQLKRESTEGTRLMSKGGDASLHVMW